MRVSRPLTVLLGLLAACVPDKESAVDLATTHYCQRALDCDWTDDVEDCEDGAEDVFDSLWEDDDCEEDGLDREGWDACLEAIDNLNCDDWTMGLSTISACEADEVCL